jgi:hypothetical protein
MPWREHERKEHTMKWTRIIAGAAVAMALAPAIAQAQSVGAVENARAKERQGTYLSPEDRDNLRRYGGNDDYGPGYGYVPYYGGYYDGYYGDGYSYGPSVSIYLGD